MDRHLCLQFGRVCGRNSHGEGLPHGADRPADSWRNKPEALRCNSPYL